MERILNMLRGHRKMIMFVITAAIAAFVRLTDNQTRLLETLVITGMGTNAAVHIGEAISAKLGVRGSGGNSGLGGAAGLPEKRSEQD